jgi:diadenosine tetraphosphate (Ap4A) HIT family hydrolase
MTSETKTPWSLDPRLAADTVAAGDLPLSRVLLSNDANYPWLILVPRRAGAVELIDLAANDRAQLMDEIARVSTVLRDLTACHKLNVATIGNMVAQLHIHVIARFRDDGAWPAPVWGKRPAKPYDPPVRDAFLRDLKAALAADGGGQLE